jgi:transposase
MTYSTRRTKTTLGYPNQTLAIVALFQRGHQPEQIAEMIDGSINAVHRVLSDYRRKHGLPVPPKRKPTPNAQAMSRESTLWDLDEDERRQAIAKRAAKAAREARLAA